jgi:hypothetical protein
LPASLTSIGGMAFSECNSLRSIVVQALKPPILYWGLWDLWDAPPPTLIYVPPAALDDYLNADVWKDYANWLRPIGSDL